jgi:ATP-dependent RNA helicase DDX19/DBP5
VCRIGRTGRFGKHGLAINLVDGPKSMAVLKQIERHFGKDIVKLDAEVNIDVISSELIIDKYHCSGCG